MPTRPAYLRLRAELIQTIGVHLARNPLTRREASKLLRVARPRVVDLLAGRTERFSLDALVTLAERAGLNVRLRATRPYRRG